MDKKDRNSHGMFTGELSDSMLENVTGGTGISFAACNACAKKQYCQTLTPMPDNMTDPTTQCTNFKQ